MSMMASEEDIQIVDTENSPVLRRSSLQREQASSIQDELVRQFETQSKLCDVTVIIDEKEIRAHWCVLLTCPYFVSLYSSGMKEIIEGRVKTDFGDPVVVQSVIKFLYNGTIKLTKGNVSEVLKVGDFLQLESLKLMCGDFLMKEPVTTDNCVSLCLLCSMYNMESIYRHAYKYLCSHLPQVIQKDDVLNLTDDSIKIFFKDQRFMYVPGKELFNFLVRWVEKDSEEREHLFPELFSAMDLSRMSYDFSRDVVSCHPLVLKFIKCSEHYQKYEKLVSSGEIIPVSENAQSCEVILVVAGLRTIPRSSRYFLANQATDWVFGYAVSERRWIQLPPLPQLCKKPMIVCSSTGQHIYVADRNQNSTIEMRFSLMKWFLGKNEWSSMSFRWPEFLLSVEPLDICLMGENLYVFASATVTSGPRRYHILQLDMARRQMTLQTTLFTGNPNLRGKCSILSDKVFSVLAWDNEHSNRRCKFFMFNCETTSNMNCSTGLGTVTSDPLIYVQNNELIVSCIGRRSAKAFSLETKRWRTLRSRYIVAAPELEHVKDVGMCYYNNRMFVFGGMTEAKSASNNSLCYSFDKKQWAKLPDLPKDVANTTCCAVTLPSRMVQCHIQCPHCEYYGRRYLASYVDDQESDLDDSHSDWDDDSSNDGYGDDDFYDDNVCMLM